MAESLIARTDAGTTADVAHTPAWARWLVVVGVFAGFLAYSLIQAPVPAPNEPHYLSKAKRYWNPEFCPNDVFLDSADAHPVFYQTVGLLTTFLSLEQTAWVARVLAYALLAIGWTSCLSRLLSGAAAPLWASWVFLALATCGNLSGEWMVGGIEAKVFSYAFLLWGIGLLFAGRLWGAAALAGLAVAFHPVVGVWGVGCGVYACLWQLKRRAADANLTPETTESGFRRQATIAAAIGLLCALPGLLPALQLVLGDDHPRADEANRIQVLERLAHHLDPTKFKTIETDDFIIPAAWLAYAGLFVFWICVQRRGASAAEPMGAQRWFFHFVNMTVLIAVAGLVVGWLPRGADGKPDAAAPLFDLRVTLLKFYPFRICDVFVPLAVAIGLTRILSVPGPLESESRFRPGGAMLSCGLFAGFLLYALLSPIPDRNPSHMTPDERAEWIAVCGWIRENTPADAQVLTGSSGWAFKWYAQRAEYHSHKDCPQDAAHILEWRQRPRRLNAWDAKYPEAYTKQALRELRRDEGVTHIVCADDVGPFEIAPIYPPPGDTHNASRFRVYRLRDAN